jgi:hydrophobic/amphiphilic exporter-1 (mainly G- bacteria), HAE1 family
MFLSDFSIKRPVAMVVIIIMLMCVGLLALKNLRVNQIPDVEQPVIVISIPYPGASPETVEREIINRIEKQLLSISGVYQIRATASESSGQIVVIFNFKKNMVEAADEIRNAIAAVRYKLPLEMREPVLRHIDPGARPIMQIALSSESLSHAEISRLAEDDLSNRFRGIEGVSVVNVSGALRRELSILLRAEKLREFNISVTDVTNALRNQNLTAPVGRIRGVLDDQSIRLIGRIESPADFGQVVVKRMGGETLRLAQIAEISDGFADLSSFSLRNGNPNVSISVVRARDASTVSVANKVRAMVGEINNTLPAGTKLKITEDGGEEAQDSLNNVIESLVFGALLTIFVVYAFLNSWRSTLITALSLPTSVIAAFIAVWLCGFTLNFMTLLGLSLAIGVLIDDAIVVRENIVRHMQEGKDRLTAASEGTREIGMAVIATTFSIIAVFIPVAFMPGGSGEWFRPFALTVAASVLVSLFISFTLDPMLSAYWGDPPGHHDGPRRGLGRVLQRFNHWFDHQADRYTGVIAWALHHRRAMGIIAGGTFVAALALQGTLGGSSFLPKSDGGMLAIDVRVPSSASLGYARLKVEAAASLARTIPETVATNSNVNAGGGRIYVDIGKKKERSRDSDAIAADLRVLLTQLVGGEFVVLDDLNSGVRKPIQVNFSGPDARVLTAIANEYKEKLANVPGAVDVGLSQQEPKDELRVELNRGLANSLGISMNDAAQALRVAFAGVEVGDWVDPIGESRDVAVRLHPDDRVSGENIEHLPINVSGTGQMVPLNQIATITMGKGPSQIQHQDGKRLIAVSANAQGRSVGEVNADALKIAKKIAFPPGFGVELGGSGREQKELFSAMGTALAMGIALMYLTLVIQFNSFTAPVAVMVSLPLSLIGVVVALLLTGGTLNLMSMIGIIMLMGLVAKNAILLLDCARKREAEGYEREDALMYAGRMRLRPILMTTFALIAGMLPVAIGTGESAEFYRPLAVAIIGGTITSTILTLLVVPTFYDSIEIKRDHAIEKFKQRETTWGGFLAGTSIVFETLFMLLGLRFAYRMVMALRGKFSARRRLANA